MGQAKDLTGQVAVVTGAARGIGALVARRLAARNARVALIGLEPDGLGQRWPPPMHLARGVVPMIVGRFAARAVPELESGRLATGAISRPLGAGGAADTTAAVREARA